MKNTNELKTNGMYSAANFFGGVLLGGLFGAATMILFAPQSGALTRLQIRQKSVQLRNQAADVVEDTLLRSRQEARRLSTRAHNQAEILQQRGQEALGEQQERFATFAEAKKAAIQGALG